ncbi:class I SAM-dependent DNA methyltransferase [Methanocella sp. MCL-LM]|uniref:class I SAM-dependent DNA methyltransferase n=1 Tax=Methanocella sp. MCL-LM TaxID=3412035 RepID=UPI003C754EEA
MSPDAAELHGSCAPQYDDLCQAMECHAQDVLFGLCFEYLSPGQKLLDLGIGTGLSAALFHKAGLEVYGADFSPDMLRECEKKGLARELKVCDIGSGDWPYEAGQFHHVTACGLFHFIGDLDRVFSEARRVMVPGGTFSLTVKSVEGGKEVYVDPGSGIAVYCHDQAYIEELAGKYGFTPLKRLAFYMYDDLDKKKRSLFAAYVVKALAP